MMKCAYDIKLLHEGKIQQIGIDIPFENEPANFFLLKGPPLVLVDAGPRMEVTEAALQEALGNWGCTEKDIHHVLLTHAHFDHAGYAGVLQERFDLEVYAHPEDHLGFCMGFEERARHVYAQYRHFYTQWGAACQTKDEMAEDAAGFDCLHQPLSRYTPLAHNMEPAIDNHSFRMIHVPGHSQGSVAFYETNHRILFSGDMLLENTTPCPFFRIQTEYESSKSLVRFLDSLNRLEALDVATVLPGHGKPFSNHQDVLASYRNHFARRIAKVRELLAHENGLVVSEIAARLYSEKTDKIESMSVANEMTTQSHATIKDIYQRAVFSVVVGCLEYLEMQGEVTVNRNHAADQYSLRTKQENIA